MADHIFMLAGEASGDKLGGQILAEMQARGYTPHVSGVGGHDMQKLGLESVFPMSDLSVLGLVGAIKNYSNLKKRMDQLIAHIKEVKPRFILTIDSKAFSLKLGKTLKKMMAEEGWSVPIIHLVAPTVWAWRSWRAKSMPQSVDHLLCLFPFEVPYFTKYGLSSSAVGHPAIDITFQDQQTARKQLSLADDDIVIGLFPGSRRREVAELLPDMCLAINKLRETYPRIKAVLPAANTVYDLIQEYLTPEDNVQLVSEDLRFQVMKAADYGLICSGTVTLETALAGLHGSVYYRPDILAMIIGKLLIDRSKVVLPNAILGRELYKLYLRKEFNADTMVCEVENFLNKSDDAEFDIADDMKKALTPHDKSGKRDFTFQQSVVDEIDTFLNGL